MRGCLHHCVKWIKKHKIISSLILATVLTVGFVILLIYNPSWRVYLLVGAATLGAVFSALPIDNHLVRWAAVIISALSVGIGTWYTVFEFDKETSELNRKVDVYTLFLTSTSHLPIETKNALVLQMASTLRSLIGGPNPEPEKALDLCKILLSIDPNNGHGLYFTGEAYRLEGDKENMRGAFKQYLAIAENVPGSEEGNSEVGYTRPNGYAGERTAWVLHIMANDFYEQSRKQPDSIEKKKDLGISLADAKKALVIQPGGFERTTSLDSTDKVIGECQADLKELP